MTNEPNEPKELKRIIYSKLEEVIKYPNHIDVVYEELDALLTQSMRSTEVRMTERFRGIIDSHIITDKTGESVKGGAKGAYNQALKDIIDQL